MSAQPVDIPMRPAQRGAARQAQQNWQENAAMANLRVEQLAEYISGSAATIKKGAWVLVDNWAAFGKENSDWCIGHLKAAWRPQEKTIKVDWYNLEAGG
jgi:hypothetical protein